MSDSVYDQIAEDEKKRELAPKGRKGGSTEIFMKTSAGKYQVRLIGEPKKVYTLWDNKTKKKHIVPEDLVKKLRDAKLGVREQIASNIFDRADNKARKESGSGVRIKIMEKGSTVFKPIITRYVEVTGKDGEKVHPGGPKASDWLIKVTVSDPDDLRSTEYNVTNLQDSPFSKEEMSFIARTPDPNLIKDLLPANVFRKAVESEYAEKYKDQVLGEKGLIDLDAFYNAEKHREALLELLEAEGGSAPSADEDVLEDLDVSSTQDVKELDISDSDVVQEQAKSDSEPTPVSDEDLDSILY